MSSGRILRREHKKSYTCLTDAIRLNAATYAKKRFGGVGKLDTYA